MTALLLASVSWTLVAAPVGIRVSATDDRMIASLVADAVERALGASLSAPAVRSPSDDRCDDRPDTCFDELLTLRVFTGVTQHLVILEVFRPGSAPRKASLSLPADRGGWAERLEPVLAELFPHRRDERRSPSAPAFAPPLAAPRPIWGPVLIVASALAVASGAILGERAQATRRTLLDGTPSSAEFERLDDRRRRYAISSVASFGLAGVLAGGGVVFVLLDW